MEYGVRCAAWAKWDRMTIIPDDAMSEYDDASQLPASIPGRHSCGAPAYRGGRRSVRFVLVSCTAVSVTSSGCTLSVNTARLLSSYGVLLHADCTLLSLNTNTNNNSYIQYLGHDIVYTRKFA